MIFTNEAARLARLRLLGVLDTEPEAVFDQTVEIATSFLDVPMGALTFVDWKRQWIKAQIGLEGVQETPRAQSFCAHAILVPGRVMVVEDASQDRRFVDHPYVAGDSGVRFYAGAPLVDATGRAVGSLCVIDTEPRSITDRQCHALQVLAAQTMSVLEARLAARRLAASIQAATAALAR